MKGYPTVLFLDPGGNLLETMGSRQPGDVAAQMDRLARDQDPGRRIEEALAGVSGRPWDWLRASGASIEVLHGARDVLESALEDALGSEDLEVRQRAARIRARLDRATPGVERVRIPPPDVMRWLGDRFDALGDADWCARQDASEDLARFAEAIDLSLRLTAIPPRSGR